MAFIARSLHAPATVAALVLCLVSAGAASSLRAQTGDPNEQPAVAMGNARMIRGTVTSVAPDKITLKTEAGEVYTVALTPNTNIRHGRDAVKPADLHAGDGVGAMGEIDRPNKTVHALFVQVVTAEDLKKAKEAMGKTFIAGTVTAIDELKLTILRSDKVSQTIQVDEDTSFKRGGRNLQAIIQGGETGGFGAGGNFGPGGGPGGGAGRPRPGGGEPAGGANAAGESITLADIKVGDLVAGSGSLKAGIFTPRELLVGEPAAARRRRPDAGTPPAATPPVTQPQPVQEQN
jgi:hypothetical protein